MVFYSRPSPDATWLQASVAVCAGILIPCLLGLFCLVISDAPLAGPPKDGSPREWGSLVTLFGAAALAAPLVAWIALPLAIPLTRTAIRRGWAGWGSAMGLAIVLGLPVVHFALNGDLTNEAPKMIPLIVLVLILQGLSGYAMVRVFTAYRMQKTAAN